MKRRPSRRNRGSVAALAFVGVIPLIAAFGGLAVDSMHVNDARGALQRATDAAALAGAEYMNDYAGSKATTATSVGDGNELPVNYALQVASMNAVDGPLGLWQGSNRTISATIRHDASLGGVATQPNRCDVTGSIYIRSIFAQIFGNFGQTVTASSSAGIAPVNKPVAFAPLLVSWTDPDPNSKVLRDTIAGTEYTVIIKDMGDKISNAIWIDSSAKTVNELIDYLAGNGPRPSYDALPDYKIGDTVKASNGEKGGVGKNLDKLTGKDLVFLITDDNGIGVTAVRKPEHIITRIVGMTDVRVDATPGRDGFSITGKLYPVVVGGESDPSAGPNPVTTFAPFQVRLIQ